jgi:hypothetical protein
MREIIHQEDTRSKNSIISDRECLAPAGLQNHHSMWISANDVIASKHSNRAQKRGIVEENMIACMKCLSMRTYGQSVWIKRLLVETSRALKQGAVSFKRPKDNPTPGSCTMRARRPRCRLGLLRQTPHIQKKAIHCCPAVAGGLAAHWDVD